MMKKIMSYFACAAIMISFAACGGKDGNVPEQQEEYVDLGLPSGTLWKTSNEVNPDDEHGFYSYDEAMSKFGAQMPSDTKWRELINNCTWQQKGNGYEVSGNGKKIFLPAEGKVDKYGSFKTGGFYWSSDKPSGTVYILEFYPPQAPRVLDSGKDGDRMSVRLVK